MERILSILLVAATTTARKVVVLDDNEWDSIVVTTDPVKITNSRFNPKNTTKEHTFRFNQPSRVTRNARMMKDCDDGDLKCKYDHQLHENVQHRNPQETIKQFLEKFSSVTNVKINNELRNSSSKSYWDQVKPEVHNHPYDDAAGWVSLEPIPWSSSKVSKWKPNHAGDRPWDQGPPQHHQQTTSLWVSHNPTNQGNRPSTNWGIGINDLITDNKPNEFPLDSNSIYSPRPQASYTPIPVYGPGYQTNNIPPYPPRPQYQPHYGPPPSNNYPQATNGPTPQWQQHHTDNRYTPLENMYQSGNAFPHATSTAHPPSYPDSGKGEWVLLSTTKGYSVPQRYQDRKMAAYNALGSQSQPTAGNIVSRSLKSKYQENHIEHQQQAQQTTATRKSDIIEELGEPVWNVDGINIYNQLKPLKIREHKSLAGTNYAAEGLLEKAEPKPEMTFKRTVRLTVLPALNNTSTISHGGMLEVEANSQTVEEDARQEEERLNKLQQLAVVTTGRQPYQVVPVAMRARKQDGNDISKKRATVMAAVGAGLIPATMAVLIPAALGRRRRRSVPSDFESPYQIPQLFQR